MSIKIGFTLNTAENEMPREELKLSQDIRTNEFKINVEENKDSEQTAALPARSLVKVYFPDIDREFTYYNESFNLKTGDIVYVSGKMEGRAGRVTELAYNFKIKLSAYQRIIGVASTDIEGEFYMAGSHFVSFDRNALPFSKAVTWFKAPDGDEEYVSGYDDNAFPLDAIWKMMASPETAKKGREYYEQNRVVYVELCGNVGHAVVAGDRNYTVEFRYNDGEISRLTCDCYCTDNCKHELAAMLRLRELLERVESNYQTVYNSSGYFSAVEKSVFFNFAVYGKEKGKFTLNG